MSRPGGPARQIRRSLPDTAPQTGAAAPQVHLQVEVLAAGRVAGPDVRQDGFAQPQLGRLGTAPQVQFALRIRILHAADGRHGVEHTLHATQMHHQNAARARRQLARRRGEMGAKTHGPMFSPNQFCTHKQERHRQCGANPKVVKKGDKVRLAAQQNESAQSLSVPLAGYVTGVAPEEQPSPHLAE